MKICIISNLYDPYARGGAEKVAKIMAEGLSRDHEVFVITSMPYAGWESRRPHVHFDDLSFVTDRDCEIKVYRFWPVNFFSYLNNFKHNIVSRLVWTIFDTFNFWSARTVEKILIQEKPDLVITHNLRGLSYLIPQVIKKLKLNNYQIIHDVQYAVPSGLLIYKQEEAFLANSFLIKFYQFVCRKLLQDVPVIISPSQWLLDFYLQKKYFAQAKTFVLNNPLLGSQKQITKNKLKPYKSLLFVGQIEKHKGIDWLLKILAQTSDWQLTVVGNGTQLESLQKTYKENKNLKFLGELSSAELAEIYSSADWLIVPSLCYENSPTVIAEAFSYGLPVIASDLGGIPELVKNNFTGFLFEPGNEKELQKKLRQASEVNNYDQLEVNCLAQAEARQLEKYLEQLKKIIV